MHLENAPFDLLGTSTSAKETDVSWERDWRFESRVAQLPTRRELALRPLYVMIGGAGLVIAWFEVFWRHCSSQ